MLMGRKDVKIVPFTIDKRRANGKKEEKQFYRPLPTITKKGIVLYQSSKEKLLFFERFKKFGSSVN